MLKTNECQAIISQFVGQDMGKKECWKEMCLSSLLSKLSTTRLRLFMTTFVKITKATP